MWDNILIGILIAWAVVVTAMLIIGRRANENMRTFGEHSLAPVIPCPDEEDASIDALARILAVDNEVLATIPVDSTMYSMGMYARHDYADYGRGIDHRLGKCYELAAKAFLAWPGWNTEGLAEPVRLVHGSWHGPNALQRIDHAVVELSDGSIWEPITGAICEINAFLAYTKWHTDNPYHPNQVRENLMQHGHYGPW